MKWNSKKVIYDGPPQNIQSLFKIHINNTFKKKKKYKKSTKKRKKRERGEEPTGIPPRGPQKMSANQNATRGMMSYIWHACQPAGEALRASPVIVLKIEL